MPDDDSLDAVGSDVALDLKPDSLSKKEAQDLSSDLRNAARGPLKYILKTVLITFVIVFLLRVTHLVFPECWFWLSEQQLRDIDTIAFSGLIGGVLGKSIGWVFSNGSSS